MAITSGSQLMPPFTGAPSTALNLGTNVSPNALLSSASYPLPSSSGHGPLTTVPLPGGFTYWRVDSGSSQFTMPSLWTSPSAAYTYNNTVSNLGGIVPGGGLTIDGYAYPAGTYVFQFMDFSQGIASGGYIFLTTGGPSVLFRGCRFRGATTAPGAFNPDAATYNGTIACHYCDIGGMGSADAQDCEVGIDMGGGTAGARALRNYISYVTTGTQLNVASGISENIENYVEKLTLFYGASGPPPGGDPYHLNGICINGGNLNALMQRNHVVITTPDEAGHVIEQTDCLALFQDFGTFPGSGHNSDGSLGYVITGNYAGGTGYCFYLGQNEGTQPDTVNNVTFEQNLVTTSAYPAGGSFGPAAAIPAWGSFGNTEFSNFWADGTEAGRQDIFGATLVTLANTFSGGTSGTNITAGNSGGASGNAFDTVNAAYGGTVTYSNAQSHVGTLSGLFTMPASAVADVRWGASLTGSSVPQAWFRLYCLIPALASFRNNLCALYPAAGFGSDLVVNSAGNLQFLDSNGTVQLTSAATITPGSWFRAEGYVTGSTTAGQMEMKLFLSPDSATPTETDTSGTSVNTGGPVTQVFYGISSQGGAGGAFTEYLDGLGASTAGYIGPIPPAPGGAKDKSGSPLAAILAAR